MDLRNNQITMGELLRNPNARKVLERRFPHVMGRPVVAAAETLTLAQVIKLTAAYVPQGVVQDTLRDLRTL